MKCQLCNRKTKINWGHDNLLMCESCFISKGAELLLGDKHNPTENSVQNLDEESSLSKGELPFNQPDPAQQSMGSDSIEISTK